ncbi:MAG: hypothetical protein K1X65_05665 [Caldilineales bacterium]|nr:hypothetical protein [Caldilineales bacterium]MCW5857152.1 hypothetical protein [Caldilineales bacterium]
MSWLSRWFGTRKANASRARLARDNVGIRYRDVEHAHAAWAASHLNTYTPVVIYRFPTLDAAQQAIRQLSFIHEAADTGELISTEVIEFGCYRNEEAQGEVIVCGKEMTAALWREAMDKLAAAGGTLFRQQEPTSGDQRTEIGGQRAADGGQKAGAAAGAVTFVNEFQKGINTYRVHRGPSKAAAMAFLQAHPVDRNFFYLVVETPEGNFGRDVDGIYAE